MDFTSWTRSLGGGYDLFSSGQYPVLDPTNALAWVLDDDRFYLIKLIEPYVLGFFFVMALLWEVFGVACGRRLESFHPAFTLN